MYAAAGGASLASRQKRKNQAAQNVKNKALLQQGLKDKLAASRASSLATPTKAQSRQFHNLPSTYLRAPQAHVRKLSAGYTSQSRILLPINESNNQYFAQHHHHHKHEHSHEHTHEHFHHHHASSHDHDEHHHSKSSHHRPTSAHHHPHAHKKLTKSATAQIPLVSQYESTPPDTPTGLFPLIHHHADKGDLHPPSPTKIHIPCDDIIVTPATPLPSPGPPTADQLERKCSFYRGRKQLAYEDSLKKHAADEMLLVIGHDDAQFSDEYRTTHGISTKQATVVEKWTDSECCDSEHRHSICTCDHECAQGRAAWLERGRRCSITDNAASCHRRWVKRNRVHDASLGGSSDDDDFLGVLRGPSSFANAFLYFGLGTVALGLVISFVGTGEKGFKTIELRLIGPSLIGIGFLCCILRIFFCICPSNCISSSRRKLKKKNAKLDADHTTSLLRSDTKRVSIARNAQQSIKDYPPAAQKFLKQHPHSKMNEGMEALRQIATTSLFLQNEKANDTNQNHRIVPTIREHLDNDEPLEMRKIEDNIEICNISDGEDDDALVKLNNDIKANEPSTSLRINGINTATMPSNSSTSTSVPVHQQQQKSNKLSRSRAPINQQKPKDSDLMETSLMILDASPVKPATFYLPSTSSKPPPPPSNSLNASTTISLGHSSSNASMLSHTYNNNHAIPSTSGLQQYRQSSTFADTHPFGGIIEPMKPMKPILQDGSTNLTFVQPANVTAHSSSSFEPELVLSPKMLTKLGQQYD